MNEDAHIITTSYMYMNRRNYIHRLRRVCLPACLHFIFNLLIELHPKTKLHLFLVAIGISKYRYTVYTNVNPYVKLLTKNFCNIALYGFILHLEA